MMQAKVGALKEQEERLGALVAKLQLERSREVKADSVMLTVDAARDVI